MDVIKTKSVAVGKAAAYWSPVWSASSMKIIGWSPAAELIGGPVYMRVSDPVDAATYRSEAEAKAMARDWAAELDRMAMRMAHDIRTINGVPCWMRGRMMFINGRPFRAWPFIRFDSVDPVGALEQLMRMYLSGWAMKVMTGEFKISKSHIRTLMMALGVKMRPHGGRVYAVADKAA